MPKIKGAILLSGGSYACYADGIGTNKCPSDFIEQYYEGKNIINHPPTLLAQSSHDNNAPINASTNYYNHAEMLCSQLTSESKKTECKQKFKIIHTQNSNIKHFYFPEMVVPSLNLLLNNTCYAK